MKIATYNINGINSHFAVILRWLDEQKPDIVCLQELKTTDDKFPRSELEKAGYDAIWLGQKSWNGVAILTRGREAHETRRGLPGDDSDLQSRYIEAAINGVLVGCLYLPNGNPIPGPKFDYKLAWFARLQAHAQELLAANIPVVLAGLQSHPDRLRCIKSQELGQRRPLPARKQGRLCGTKAGLDGQFTPPPSRRADFHLLGLFPEPLGTQFRPAYRLSRLACGMPAWIERFEAGKKHLITRRLGSRSAMPDAARKPSYLDFDKSSYAWKPDVDYRAHPEAYRVGKGEQGVLIVQPYKDELVSLWRFKTPDIARTSSAAIFEKFEAYLARKDFVGADMARKFLQMGYTRARRYANYKGGRKYDAERGHAPLERGTGDPVKAESARIFYDKWKEAEARSDYAAMKAEWKRRIG